VLGTQTVTGGQALVRMLELHDVQLAFGLCGDTSLPLYDALRASASLRHILTRDERHAGYMADAYARVSGKVGVCEAPSGGGATYVLPALVEANESSIAVLAITTDIGVGSRGHFALTELDQPALFAPVTKWNASIDRAGQLPHLVREAFEYATTCRPGAVQLSLPYDVQKDMLDAPLPRNEGEFARYPARRALRRDEAVTAAAKFLAGAQRPLFICGGGVVISGAQDELAALARRIGAVVATTISGKGSIAETDALAVGVVGSNGGVPETRELVDAADLVVFVGCRAGSVTTERWRHPKPGGCKIVHVDIDAATIGANYPTDAAVVGDAKLALRALDTELQGMRVRGDGGGAMRRVAKAKEAKFARFRALADEDVAPIRPERLVMELERALSSYDAIVIADPGTPCPYLSAYLTQRKPARTFVTNRAHGALGYALGAACGAQFAAPGRKIVAVMGDGSFAMTCGELETLTRYQLPITLVVVSNAEFGWIKAGQKHGFGQRFFSVDFTRTDHARVAQAFGLVARRVEDPRELAAALQEALRHDGPALVDVIAQPLEEARAPVSEWIA
jgi:acetolactate synthase-1/2/3 large subunit